jgi:hypothetical protein
VSYVPIYNKAVSDLDRRSKMSIADNLKEGAPYAIGMYPAARGGVSLLNAMMKSPVGWITGLLLGEGARNHFMGK